MRSLKALFFFLDHLVEELCDEPGEARYPLPDIFLLILLPDIPEVVIDVFPDCYGLPSLVGHLIHRSVIYGRN